MKPLVLLDVDGVVHAWGIRDLLTATELGCVGLKTPEMPWGVVMTEDTQQALRIVFEGAHEVLWCSSWRHKANTIMPLLYEYCGVPAGTVLDVVTDGGSFQTDHGVEWKLTAALEHEKVIEALAEGRRVIWFEDIGWGTVYEAHWTKEEIRSRGVHAVDVLPEGYLRLQHLAGTGLV